MPSMVAPACRITRMKRAPNGATGSPGESFSNYIKQFIRSFEGYRHFVVNISVLHPSANILNANKGETVHCLPYWPLSVVRADKKGPS